MRDLFETLPAESRGKLRRRSRPAWTQPMLATLSDEPFSDPDWIYERKLDGVRCLAFRTLKRLAGRLRKIEHPCSPFDTRVPESDVHYVQPALVGEFGFTEWTDKGRLRHPGCLGLREDKSPEQVQREQPEA